MGAGGLFGAQRSKGIALSTVVCIALLFGSAFYLLACSRTGGAFCPAATSRNQGWTGPRCSPATAHVEVHAKAEAAPVVAADCPPPPACPAPKPAAAVAPKEQVMGVDSTFLPADALRRGTANYGSGERMRRLGQKLLAGQPITVTFLGGSITWGRGGYEDGPFVARFERWLQATFPHPDHRIINHGLPAVTSALFAACFDKVPEESDLVVLDFAVNDGHAAPKLRDELGYSFTGGARRGFEQLVRKSLKLEAQPAVALLHFFSWNATRDKHQVKGIGGVAHGPSFFFRTIEDELTTVAQYYDAPVLSLRNAVYHLLREQRHGFQWDTNLHHVNRGDPTNAHLLDSQFFWDENHPWDRTGHRAMAELLMAAVTRGVQDAAEAQQLAAAAAAADGAEAANAASAAALEVSPMPPPMVPENYEANATSCHLQEDFQKIVVYTNNFNYEPRAPKEETFVAQKWGLTAEEPGATAVLKVNSDLGGLSASGKAQEVQVHLLYLRSWRGMGRAKVECATGCECKTTEMDGHWDREATLTDLFTVEVTPHPECRLRIKVLDESSSGEHGFTVSGAVVSSVDARMERGKIGQWDYDKKEN